MHAELSLDRADGRSLRSGFLRSASQLPDKPCLVVKGESYSYSEVEESAGLWAEAIVGALGGPARRVGVFGYRSRVSYVGVLAALFSGATFVPLNPTFPRERTRDMILQAELDAIIVDQTALKQLQSVLDNLEHIPVLLAPEAAAASDLGWPVLSAADLSREAPLDALPPLLPNDIAYLLFTSGSTGRPKGVPVTHANANAFLDFAAAHYGITHEDRFSQTFDQTFDLSIFDLFLAWEKGATVYALQPLDLIAPARFIARNALTVWFSVPSIPALMRKKNTLKPDALPSLRISLFCGEPLPAETAQAWQAAAPQSIVENLYGPTELTIACLWYRWNADTSPEDCVNGIVPIGRPFPGLGAAVVDEELRPVADGAAGELSICGPQTTPGYWRDPVKTAERFVELPGQEFPTERFYRTGDRVRRLPSGDYVYLGRTDHQIKVMGFRVELGEIEACLLREPNTVEAVAVGWPVRDGSAEGIVAFVSGSGVDLEWTQAEARRRLPHYMVPNDVRIVEVMPLNANGKIDRKALLETLSG
ncbi:MAG: amino acid adenylation domain-containing protein [Sphingomicrobium sp.]|nr:amino acid adenylation domain-containing protein [Sphingomonadales bacterium]